MFTKIRRTDVKKCVIVLVRFVDGKLSAPMRIELRESLYFEVLELRFSNCYLEAPKLICLHDRMSVICLSVCHFISLSVCLSGCLFVCSAVSQSSFQSFCLAVSLASCQSG